MDNFIQYTINALTLGSVYALIALGYSLVYGILKLLNFAHGDVYMVGAYIGYGWVTVFGGSYAMHANPVLVVVLMFVTAMIGCGLLGVMIERFAYRRLRAAPRIAPLITALGVSFFLQNSAQLILVAQQHSYNSFIWQSSPIALNVRMIPAQVHVTYPQIIVVVGTIILVL